jgi:hypothetical protein
MSDRSFTGNECWVHQADAVDQLAGRFGVSVTCLYRRAIRRLSLARFPDDQDSGATLAVEVQAGNATHDVHVRLGGLGPADLRSRLAGVGLLVEVVR